MAFKTKEIAFSGVGSHSGLVRTLGERVSPQGDRGFESLSHRLISLTLVGWPSGLFRTK